MKKLVYNIIDEHSKNEKNAEKLFHLLWNANKKEYFIYEINERNDLVRLYCDYSNVIERFEFFLKMNKIEVFGFIKLMVKKHYDLIVESYTLIGIKNKFV